MGGSPRPIPMAGRGLNDEFMAKFAKQRQEKNLLRSQLMSEAEATLAKTGQRRYDPYKSPYELDAPSYRDFFG